MFDLERFIADCRQAVLTDPGHEHVQDILLRAMADPAAISKALGEPKPRQLYRSHSLTILNVAFPAGFTASPHDHGMWSVIGIYDGQEDNVFWRRLRTDDGERIEAAGAKSLATGDVKPFGKDIIHSVTNPTSRPSCAIHIYGGDFFDVPRSEWDPETLVEHPLDVENLSRIFGQG